MEGSPPPPPAHGTPLGSAEWGSPRATEALPDPCFGKAGPPLPLAEGLVFPSCGTGEGRALCRRSVPPPALGLCGHQCPLLSDSGSQVALK